MRVLLVWRSLTYSASYSAESGIHIEQVSGTHCALTLNTRVSDINVLTLKYHGFLKHFCL